MSVTHIQVDLADIEDAVGRATFGRGTDYARRGAVLSVSWDHAETALHGTVRGGDVYESSAYFDFVDGNVVEFAHGECTCPVGLNCKHVVAVVVTATQRPRGRERPPKPTWDQPFQELVGDGQDVGADTPLAVELTLAPGGQYSGTGFAVRARIVRAGKTGWVASGLSWNQLGVYHVRDYRASHVRLLRELYALHLAGTNPGYQSYYDTKSVDLASFDSAKLWSLLDEAQQIGLKLVHARKSWGEVAAPGVARIALDVTGNGAVRTVSPVIGVDGVSAEIEPVCFVGSGGHGLVYADRAETEADADCRGWHFRLARFATPVPPPLQRLVLDKRRLTVPESGRTRFRDEFYPRLRRLAPVISSDGAFTPPEISGPTLVVRAEFGAGHALGVGWEWAYEVGDSRLRVPLDAPESEGGYRDHDAERAVLASVEQIGPRPDQVSLNGIDTMRFVTQTLPLLAGHPRVVVETSGEQVDYREASDTVSIGVSTEELVGETDWFDLGITISVEGTPVPFVEVFSALSQGESHMLLADGAYFSLHKPELRALAGLIEEARALQDAPGGRLRISRFQAGLWEELAGLGVVERQAEAWQRQVEGLLSGEALRAAEVPATLDARLRPYQVDGFGWLAFLWQARLGGILADDMGLGKTVQALALICHAKKATPDGPPFLIVAPTSVVSNWATESARFAPGLNVVVVPDTARRRGRTLDELIGAADVVVTSYTVFRIDFDAYSAASWSGLVLDEAQFAKNHQSKIHQCARMLPAPFKLAITGTPMENNLMELWSLLSITAPGLFPSPNRFREYYSLSIEKRADAERLAQLRRRIKPLVKRRTKEQVVADLPAKQEQVLEVELHPRHRKIYQTQLQRERQKVLGLIDDVNKNRFTILRSLTLLRQLSLHAGLVDDEHHDLPCGKIDTLTGQLHDVIDGGHRALVFSQFTGFLDKVRAALDTAGVEYCYLDGKTRGRAAVLKRFKEGTAPVFLISLKAGGFGLNLTEADYCFLLDPWWNPATEAQAVDRTHRIGQTRNVMVYRLVAKDTIEEKVMALKAKKAELFTSVMDDGNVFDTKLSADDIRDLFALS
ncbi:helicase [Saccharothrix sp. ALI-22-I]|uniref:DEAD/DEAH box helicase n=1 Tax=Saccharothrix sp. ALI-22-I TaxID=1933778 RepID=UPI00097CB5B6|nr:DEAD/DEAH box helicase [Saccharothrix sp. ALI-22-I]ONI88854.1 helicase [Saccharothrix sp. ALI-22-I]